ncbi:MAG: heterodisulfide reductase-related iron-sulfur binding cluster, partial [Myxococcota bacterium]|nr:heterodisulfide reductase-related iron-sulfur binding cluster [Myxococcota bacterium]
DNHEFLLDFPKLVHRHRAQKNRADGTSLRDSILGNPDLAARTARMSLGLANVMNRVSLHRWFLEKLLGIHREKLLPHFAATTFSTWARKQGRSFEPGGEAVLFPTCYIENNEPEVGQDTCSVYDRNQVDLRCAKGLECCGMPSWEHGDLDTLRARAKANLDALLPHVEAGSKVVVINPTCSMMLRKEYPELLEGADRDRAEELAEAVQDVSEFLWDLRKEDRFAGEAASSPGQTIAYHSPCHLRAQRVGFKGRDLIRKVTGSRPSTVMECCGHDGTWAMKVEGFEDSQVWGRKAFAQMAEGDAEVWATDCPLAALQFQQHAGVKPMHPMTILARAYDGAELPDRAEPEEDP